MKLPPVATLLVGSAVSGIRSALRDARSRVYAVETFEQLDQGADEIRAWMRQVADELERMFFLYPTLYAAAGVLRAKFGPIWHAAADAPSMSVELLRQGLDGLCQAADQIADHVAQQIQERD